MRNEIKIVEPEQGLEASDGVYKYVVAHLERIYSSKYSEY
jgi:hypothetical protein